MLLLSLSTFELVATVSLFVVATVAMFAWQWWQRRGAAGPLRVTALYIYPVKSCAPIPLPAASFNRLGFRFDRQWALVDAESGRTHTARDSPHMLRILPSIDESAGTMTLTFALEPSWESLTIPLLPQPAAQSRKIILWDDELTALRVGDEADAWFTRVIHWNAPGAPAHSAAALARQYQLVSIRSVEDHARPVSEKYDWPAALGKESLRIASGGFSDAFPFLLTSRASLDALNKWTAPEGRVTEMAAFRPNIVVEGGNLREWEEDRWRIIDIGPTAAAAVPSSVAPAPSPATSDTSGLDEPPAPGACRFVVSKPCGRCVLTTLVPSDGTRHTSGEPLQSLRAHRKMLRGKEVGLDDEAFFGVNLLQLAAEGRIRVGDTLTVRTLKAENKVHEFAPNYTAPKKK